MTTNNTKTTKSGIGFFGLLQLAFIVLKLCNVINWNWYLVLIPLMIICIIYLIIILIGVIMIIIGIIQRRARK